MKKRILNILLTIVLVWQFALQTCALPIEDNETSNQNQSQIEPTKPTNNSTLYLTNNFATHYFSKLTTNYPHNSEGSCAYTAMAMLLSFYDTYWDDTILTENFDAVVQMSSNQYDWGMWESPGTHKDINHGGSGKSYYDVCQTQTDLYLQCYLIHLNGGWRTRLNLQTLQLEYHYGLNHSKAVELLETYWSDYIPYKMQIVYVTSNVRQSAIEYIKQGIPVVFSVRTDEPLFDRDYHSVVGYDYDEENDRIFVHAGWGAGDTHTTITDLESSPNNPYMYYMDFYALVPNESYGHVCSNNYQYTGLSGSTSPHCPCEYLLHPAHVHIHDEYLDVSEDWHTFNCETCGLSGIEDPHEYIRYGRNPGPLTGTTHRHYCHCGYYEVKSHVIRLPEGEPLVLPTTCILCGFPVTSGDVSIASLPDLSEVMLQGGIMVGTHALSDGSTIQILTETGSYVLSNGIIVLSPEDAALVEAGLLDPYELVENITVPAGPGHVTE